MNSIILHVRNILHGDMSISRRFLSAFYGSGLFLQGTLFSRSVSCRVFSAHVSSFLPV